MILVIGAMASGKLEYVKSLGYTDADISRGAHDERPVLYALEELVFSDPGSSPALLDSLLKKDIVVCCEVGSGVIPAERTAREAREATGRLCCRLAERAEGVIRLVSGIPVKLK